MERQEEEKRKIHRDRRTKSKSASSFPQDLTSEILLRLPARSVCMFRCVSKLWLSITTDPYFINLFETRLSTLTPSLLLCFKEGNKLFVSSIPQHQKLNESNHSSQPLYRYHMELPEISYFIPTESVHGLICFQDSDTLIVWNPSKRQYLTLTKPINSWNATISLGYDPVQDKHKVVLSYNECQVLTLGSVQETWRTVKTNPKHRSVHRTSGRCIKGVIYYLAYIYQRRVIMSFDVRSEKFGIIDLPSSIRGHMLINYEGRLACFESFDRNKTTKRTLWILEDGEKHKWSSKEFLVPFDHYDERLRIWFLLKGFTHANELIYVPSTFNKSYYVLFCDPARRSFRRFEFKGIADVESRTSQGATLYTFPNHIESLMSL